jgi:cytochrome b involved in lipid metabolism
MLEDYAIIILAAVGVLSVLYFVSSQKKQYGSHMEQLKPKKAPLAKDRVMQEYTMDEVRKHNKLDDAWLVIADKTTGVKKVYDITTYVDEHPGGESILNNVGGDATEGFHGPQHPPTVLDVVEEYLIGTLKA